MCDSHSANRQPPISPIVVWRSRDSRSAMGPYGAGVRVAYITAKSKKKRQLRNCFVYCKEAGMSYIVIVENFKNFKIFFKITNRLTSGLLEHGAFCASNGRRYAVLVGKVIVYDDDDDDARRQRSCSTSTRKRSGAPRACRPAEHLPAAEMSQYLRNAAAYPPPLLLL